MYQPYRPLLQFIGDLGRQYEDSLQPLAWYSSVNNLTEVFHVFVSHAHLLIGRCALVRKIVNDSLRTDLGLLYPPHLIAIGTLHHP